ncbi:hypothetical protein ACIBCT_13705 [Streptosporangium sp. NPDC050855]|uniref:hypothetical protein n=1 Tax=Streptosporangium sp. NPDC050855 TaxID=3366194 RepID=UPI0037BBF497
MAMLATMATGLLATPAAAASTGQATAASAVAKPKPKPAVWAGTPKASPAKYSGECPVTVTFSSRIKVKAVKSKTTVAYRWLHGDGSKSKVKSFTFRGKGVKNFTVKEKATFKGDVKGWQAIQLLAPRAATSAKGRFAVSCGAGEDDHEVIQPPKPRVDARIWVDEGDCKATLIGRISASGVRWVRYQWVVNGHVVDRDAVRVDGSRRVYHVIKPRDDFRGWASLEILGPVDASSGREYFKIRCEDEAPKVWAGVSAPSDYTGTCPATRTFTGTISVSRGHVAVKYRWIRDGVAGDWQRAYFGGKGPQRESVSDTWSASASGQSKRAIEIYGGPTTDTVTAKVVCTPPPTPTLTPTPSA